MVSRQISLMHVRLVCFECLRRLTVWPATWIVLLQWLAVLCSLAVCCSWY